LFVLVNPRGLVSFCFTIGHNGQDFQKKARHMSTVVQKHTPDQPLVFTDAAAKKVFTLVQEEGNPALKLRTFITGGGCSGFQYGFTFDEKQNEDDIVIEKKVSADDDDDGGEGTGGQSVCLLVDPLSFQYLMGATIDYREDLNGAQFVVSNPNAKTTCGCGSSFSVG
jgi:iron-sulfur cluster insertion protein